VLTKDEQTIKKLSETAKVLRTDIIRMITAAGSGHPGGSLSAVEIVTALYFNIMNVKPEEPAWPDRDRFVLSKGHAAPLLYAALAEKGYFDKEELLNLRRLGSMLQGHPDMQQTPGLDMSTGSLGQGLSVGVGMALAGKLDKKPYRVYVLIGDGETEEGQIWEAAMAAAHYRLDNLTVFVDHNRLQIDGPISEVMSPEPLAEKFSAFNWNVISIDGHNFEQIIDSVNSANAVKGRPSAIICDTVKGQGVSFMRDQADWHGKAPKSDQMELALRELAGEVESNG
jgi:transketolase